MNSLKTATRFLCRYSARISYFRHLPVVSVNSSRSRSSSRNEEFGGGQQKNQSGRKQVILASVVGATCAAGALYWKRHNGSVACAAEPESESVECGSFRSGLPTYTAEEVSKHRSKETGIWVTYKEGVYDITDYVSQHPGGNKILLAAGGSLAPFWQLYGVHKEAAIMRMAEEMRIGNLQPTPGGDARGQEGDDPYSQDPPRSPILIPSARKPFNAEPPPQLLVENFLTPNELFYVRNHLPVPQVDVRSYRLEVRGSSRGATLSLQQLRSNFPPTSVAAVVQCAGNRRSDMVDVKPVKGLNWGPAAIGNAQWTGVTLGRLLAYAGIDLQGSDQQHVVFEGMDKGPEGALYSASIPMELARALKDDIIIAYQMNGEDLPADHGYPVRVVIPGVVGARQVKWLRRIYLSQEESECHWQRRDYKGFNSSIDWHNVDFDSSTAIMQLPVISAICEPPPDTTLEPGAEEVTLKGYAWSGGGRSIIRVDVSTDGGQTWHTAHLTPNGQSAYKSWAWSLWEATVPLPPTPPGQQVELVCKAVDISYNVQPDQVAGIWNLRGVLSNAWHRVKVTVPPA